MKYEVFHDIKKEENIFILTISYCQMAGAKLYPFDYTLFQECTKSDKVSDKLLGLEVLARRIEDTVDLIEKEIIVDKEVAAIPKRGTTEN